MGARFVGALALCLTLNMGGASAAQMPSQSAPQVASATALSTQNARGLVALVQDPLVMAASGPRPNGGIIPSGAMGVNRDYEAGRRPAPLVEDQRGGADWIIAGLLRQRPDWVQRGWRAVQWGLELQTPQGGFPQGREPIHSTTLFTEAAGRSVIVDYALGSPDRALAFADDVVRAARWLATQRPEVSPEMVNNARFTHRMWAMAAALAYGARIANDDSLEARSAAFADQALAAETSEGIFPEKGGYDLGYQAASIVFGARYAAVVRDPVRRGRVIEALTRGAIWLEGRVQEDGSADPSGSTRILKERDRYGNVKHIPYGMVAEALASAAWLSHRSDLSGAATRVVESEAFKKYFTPAHP